MKSFKLFSRDKNDPNALNARSMILPILFCLVCGILLIAFGELAPRITAYVLAGVMLLCGIWSVIAYIRSAPVKRITESRLANGLILLVAGVLLAFNPNYLNDSLPFIWGLALLFGGFLKIQYAFDEKTVRVEKWWIMLILAAFSLIIGDQPAESRIPGRKQEPGNRYPAGNRGCPGYYGLFPAQTRTEETH